MSAEKIDAKALVVFLNEKIVRAIEAAEEELGFNPHPSILQGVLLALANDVNDLLLEEAGYPELAEQGSSVTEAIPDQPAVLCEAPVCMDGFSIQPCVGLLNRAGVCDHSEQHARIGG